MSMRDHMNPYVHLLSRSQIREFTRLANETPGCIKLTLGEPDSDTPGTIVRAAADSLKDGDTHYIANSGSYDLRASVSDHERSHNGLSYDPAEIIITAGATEALFISLLGIIRPGDEVIIPHPAFVLYEEIVKLCGGKAVSLDTTDQDYQIRGDSLTQLITDRTKAVILNSPHNPTGCIYDMKSIHSVRKAVSGRSIFVLCDDVYRQLCYSDDYHSFAELGAQDCRLREQIIVIQSFSKPYAMTGWRMGYLMADRTVTERLELVHQYNIVSTPAPFQKACIEALSYDPREMTDSYRRRRDYVCGRLDEMGMSCIRPEGAFYVFPSVRQYGLSSGDLCRRLIAEAGVAVTPGLAFGSDDHIRISYCCSMRDLEEGMDRLDHFVSSLKLRAAIDQ